MRRLICGVLIFYCILNFPNQAIANVVEVTNTDGKITSPSSSECNNGFFMRSWKFSLSPDSALFLQFDQFHIKRCDEATLIVKTRTTSNYCGELIPSIILESKSTEVKFTSDTPRCSNLFSFSYKTIRISVTLLTPHFHQRVGKYIKFLLDLRNLPTRDLQFSCSFICNQKMIFLANTTETVSCMYETPGKVSYLGQCETPFQGLEIKTAGELYLENELLRKRLQLELKENYQLNERMTSSNSLTITHIYLFPIFYLATLGNSSVELSVVSTTFDLLKYSSQSKTAVSFHLQPQDVALIGPGQHNFHLALQNNVSFITYTFPIYINEKLGLLNVTSIGGRYVGMYPHFFPVQLTLTKGAPANITLSIQDIRNTSNAVKNVSITCISPISCQRTIVNLMPPKYTKEFIIVATAENALSFSEGVSEVIETVPKVYDVYFDSKRVFPGMSSILLLYVKGDVGNYNLNLFINETLKINTELVVKATSDYDVSDFPTDVPINIHQYTKFTFELTFEAYGVFKSLAMIYNENESYNFTGNLLFQQKPSCLAKTKIRTLSKDVIIPVPQRGLTLSVDVDFNCFDSSSLEFQWSAFREDKDFETPKLQNQVQFLKSSTGSEIEITTNELPPGLYIVIVVATASTAANHQITAEQKDYVRIEVPTRKMEVVIAGGSIREFGNSSVVNFTANTPKSLVTPSFNWFCAASKEELPNDATLGKLKRKGSCFGWDPLLIGVNKSITVNNFQSNTQYFIRVIVTAKGYEDSHDDQNIFLSPNRIPNLSVKCITNCKRNKLVHLPIVLQSQCMSCVMQSWSLNNVTLNRCQNKTRCKVMESELIKLEENQNQSINVKGYNSEGNTTTIIFNFQVYVKPIGRTCTISPYSGVAYKTLFSVHCTNYLSRNDPVLYKFSVSTKGTGKFLNQYGYLSHMKDFILPPGNEPNKIVNIIVDICSGEGACNQQTLKARVSINHQISKAISNKVNFAINAKNLQRLVQLVVPISSENALTSVQRNKIVESLNTMRLVSGESYEQASVLLNHVTNKPDELSENNEKILWEKLAELETVVKNISKGDQTNLTPIIEPCMQTVANLMRMKHSKQTKVSRGTIRMSEFSRVLMRPIMPGDSPVTYESASTRTKLLRTDHNTIGRVLGNTSDFYLESLSPIVADEIINLEVSQYKTKQIDFDTQDRKVDHVTSVFITTGWLKPVPVSPEKLYRLPPRFTVAPKPQSLSVRMQTSTSCNFTICNLRGAVTMEKHLTQENTDGAFIIIEVTISNRNVANLQLQLITKSNNNTNVNTIVSFQGHQYTWKIPNSNLPKNIKDYEIKILAQFKNWTDIYSVVNAKIVTYLTNCFYWDDAVNNWNHIGCYPNTENRVVTCQCDHFPITSLGRSSVDSNNVPTLFASRLIVYPNKIRFDKLSWNLWEEFLKNPIIISILFLLYSSYIGLWFWARKADKNSENGNCFIDVRDNSASDNYGYYVTIYVGSSLSSGTQCTVAIMLIGTNGIGNAHIIQNWNEEILNSGSVCSFLITTSGSLGSVTGIRLWCSDRPNETKWHLQRIAVRDLETNECCFFLCSSWITNNSEVLFKVATYRELHTFYRLLRFKGENFIRDRHLWVSMFAMRPWQREEMTRVERLSSCYQLIFLILLTTLMFYGSSASQTAFQIVIGSGSYKLKWAQVAIGLEVGLLCFPLTVVVTALFRLCQSSREKPLTHNIIDSSRSLLLKQLQYEEHFTPLDRKRENKHHKNRSATHRRSSSKYLKQNGSSTSIDKLKRKKDRERQNRKREKRKAGSGNKHRTLEALDHVPLTSRQIDKEHNLTVVTPSAGPNTPAKVKGSKLRSKLPQRRLHNLNSNSDLEFYHFENQEFLSPMPSTGYIYGYLSYEADAGLNHIRHPIVDIDPYSGNFRPLPRSFIVVPWMIIVTTVGVSSVICVMYGMTYGLDITIEWLFSLCFAILNSFILVEPITALALAYLKVVNNPRHDLKDWLTPISEKVYKRLRKKTSSRWKQHQDSHHKFSKRNQPSRHDH
ncbi:polycystin family receptor for egg jelly-like [Ciona intestinalis]